MMPNNFCASELPSFASGSRIEKDYQEAIKWWTLAANGGQVDAQFNLGLIYYRGLSVNRDDKKSVELFTQAAEQGHGYAQYSLAVMYSFGHGVEKSYASALSWYRKSAEQGIAQAQFNMGVFYENGYAVERDLDVAQQWYERATAQGLAEASEKLDNLKKSTPLAKPEEITTYTIDEISPDGIKREEWVLRQNPETYTLQIGSVKREEDIVQFIKENNLETDAAYIEVVIDDVTRYNAVYGVYTKYSDAEIAAEQLPKQLRIKPWVRNFGILQNMLN